MNMFMRAMTEKRAAEIYDLQSDRRYLNINIALVKEQNKSCNIINSGLVSADKFL